METVRNVGIKNVSTQCHRNRASLLKTLCFARYAAWQLEKTRGPRVFPFYFVKTPCGKGFPEGRQAQWEETRLACSLLCEEEGSRGTQSSDGVASSEFVKLSSLPSYGQGTLGSAMAAPAGVPGPTSLSGHVGSGKHCPVRPQQVLPRGGFG